jgi:hypothetical protein
MRVPLEDRGVSPAPRVRHGGDPDEPPPLGSWKRLYSLVLLVLVADLVLLAWLTHRFR